MLFRSFAPPTNPIGFGISDFLELLLALLLLLGALFVIPYIQPAALRLAPKTKWCMALLAALPIVLRLALLAHHPVPTPQIADEFSHLLVADTLRHLRLANPAHPMHRFFETFFVLQQPTYSSIYPVGQGIPLALGKIVFGLPWAGVLLSTAAFCSLCYWMLRAWTTPGWSLVGGIIAVVEFGPLSLWMNDYWGGSFAAAGGCLVFGALPRLKHKPALFNAFLLGLGFSVHLLTRPFESALLGLSALVFLSGVRPRIKLTAAAAPVLFTVGFILLQNQAVTGSWRTLPYVLSQNQYGVPASLSFQANPVPHRALTPEQETEYRIQLAFKPKGGETLATYWNRLTYRVHYYRFFFLPPLYLSLVAFLFTLHRHRGIWILATLALFSLGLNFFPAFQFHYLAGVTCLFVLISVSGLERIGGLKIRHASVGVDAARWLVILCVAHFVFWYAVHALEPQNEALALRDYDTWNRIDQRNGERRIAVARQLDALPGQLLVFVRYYPNHPAVEEWVWNDADIDQARVVWARDLGPAENEQLRSYYPQRTAILLQPDFRPMPRLTPYQPDSPAVPIGVPLPPPTSPFEDPK